MPLGALVPCHAGEQAAAERDLQPLKEWGTPVLVEVGPMPYPVLGRMLDETAPEGALNYWKSSFIRGLDDELIDTLVERFRECRAPLGQILIEHFHGAVTRVDAAATAVPHRRPGYNVVIPTQWFDPATTEENIRWTRETFDALGPYRADGRWLNYYDDDEDATALQAAYGANGNRLAEIKRRYDPDNVFHHNQNIAPAPAGAEEGRMTGDTVTTTAVTAVGRRGGRSEGDGLDVALDAPALLNRRSGLRGGGRRRGSCSDARRRPG